MTGSKTPKADALRAMREAAHDRRQVQAKERAAMLAAAAKAAASVPARKPRKPKARKPAAPKAKGKRARYDETAHQED